MAVLCNDLVSKSNTQLFTVGLCIVQTDECNFLLLTSAVTQIHTENLYCLIVYYGRKSTRICKESSESVLNLIINLFCFQVFIYMTRN